MWTTNNCFHSESDHHRILKGLVMNNMMNKSVNPCDNFYKYACGMWVEEPIGDSSGVFGLITNMMNRFLDSVISFRNYSSYSHYNNEKLQRILESSEVKKIHKYFSMCREQKSSEYKPYIEAWDLPGGWPIFNSSWNSRTFDWLNVTANLKLIGSGSLINVHIGTDYQDTTQNKIYILPEKFRLPDFFEKNPKVIVEVFKLISSQFPPFGLNELDANKFVSYALTFETKLARIYHRGSNEDKEEIDEVTLATLEGLIPDIDFHRLLNIISGEVVSRSQKVIIVNRSYFTNLSTFLKGTDPEILANYLLYRLFVDIDHLQTVDVHCTDEVRKPMDFLFGYIYNTIFNDERDNEDVRTIAQSIKSVFSDTMQTVDWIDADTKQEASTKLDNLLLEVGASDDNPTIDNIIEEVAHFDFDPSNYYKSYFNLLAYSTRKPFRKFNKRTERSDESYNTATVNVFYDILANRIIVPTIILRSPVYDFHSPHSVKYGSVGWVLGHQFTHAMHGKGRIIDSKGVVGLWWTKKSEKEYRKRIKCLQDQYGNHTPSCQTLPANTKEHYGKSIFDKNVLDTGGIRLAYQAYKDWYARNPDKQETLPILTLTNMQIFFLSFAQFCCEISMPEHSLSENYVIGTLSNFEEFSKVFNCPIGSKMNPAEKCRVW